MSEYYILLLLYDSGLIITCELIKIKCYLHTHHNFTLFGGTDK